MKNVKISLNIPEDVLASLKESKDEATRHFQISLAAMLFQEGHLTLGRAVQMSGLDRYSFEKFLHKNGIPLFNTGLEQVREDVAKL